MVSGVIGFVIGININSNTNNAKDFIGTYKTNTWNGKEAIIALNKDKTMICPNGNGTWSFEDGKLYLIYNDSYISAMQFVNDFNEEKSENVQRTEKNDISSTKQEVTIIEGGLMYSGHFFEKINK